MSSLVQVVACCLFRAKPSPESIHAHHRLIPQEQNLMRFYSKFKPFHSGKCTILYKISAICSILNNLIQTWLISCHRSVVPFDTRVCDYIPRSATEVEIYFQLFFPINIFKVTGVWLFVLLIHQNLNTLMSKKMAAIFHTFSNAFSWMEMYKLQLRFRRNLFPMAQSTTFQHWSK